MSALMLEEHPELMREIRLLESPLPFILETEKNEDRVNPIEEVAHNTNSLVFSGPY